MQRILVTVMAALFATTATAPAFADHRRHDRGTHFEYRYEYRYKKEYRPRNHHYRDRHRHRRHVERDRDAGDAIAAGILGLAVGAIAAGILNQQQQNDRNYFPPAPCGGYDHPDSRKRCPRGHVLEGPAR